MKNSKSIFVLLTALLISTFSSTFGQDSQKFIGGSLGINDFHLKDEHILPITYRGILFAPAISYSVYSENSRQFLEICYNGGKLNSNFKQDDVTNYGGTVSYNYLRLISTSSLYNKRLEFFIGGGFLSAGWYTKYNAIDIYLSGFSETIYFGNYLNFSSRCELNLEKNHQFYLNINLPVIQFVSRPDYQTWTLDNFATKGFKKADFIWNNFVIHSSLGYKTPLNENFVLQLEYKFIFTFYPDPLPYKMYSNNFSASILWRI